LILLDTSALIDGLTGPRRSARALREAIERGERIAVPSLVLYEWLRGPRRAEELEAQEALFPRETAVAFSAPEAALAASIYRRIRRPRRREIDLAIAVCALVRNARLWTLNLPDFEDIPDLLVSGPGVF
jgi:predicted nucleic acid-binding protein